nr:winged helix-turn-helix domain-containing protein [Actibacterium sp. 188UL27-1]
MICGSEVIGITPKAAAVLGHLAARKDKIVPREELIDAVWPGLHVTPDLVREYIFDLRAALGDDAKSPRYIETVRGKGFRLIGDIVPTTRRDMVPHEASKGEIRPMIAVLRPDCYDTAPQWQGFMDGVAEDITIMLTRAREIAVVSRHSSFAIDTGQDLRDVATHLGAGYLLVSSIAVFDDTARIVFQLVDGRTGGYIWSHRSDDPIGALLPLGDKIVGQVANALVGWQGEVHRAEFRMIAGRDDASLNGYQHFVRACDPNLQRDANGLRKSLQHLDQCLARQPDLVSAWVMTCVVCHCLSTMSGFQDQALLKKYDRAVEKAFTLDPNDVYILYILALKSARSGDQVTAHSLIRRAMDQHSPDARSFLAISALCILIDWNPDAALEALDNGLSRITLPAGWHRMFEARLAFFLGDYSRAVDASMAGRDHVTALVFRCLSQAMSDDLDAASQTLATLRGHDAAFDFRSYANNLPIAHPEALARYYQAVARVTRLDDTTPHAVLAECTKWAAQ